MRPAVFSISQWLRGGAAWLIWLPACYGLILLVTRLLSSQSLEHDEAEQILFSQRLAWGYSLQPPLYTWLTWLFLQIFGMNRIALVGLKIMLLLGLFGHLARLLRRLDVPTVGAAPAAMMLLFCPFFAWNVSLNLTHTVLSTTLFAAVLLQGVRLYERPTLLGYGLLGILLGLGVLAKYNFGLFASALGLAALLVPGMRRVLLDRRLSISVAAALLVVLPHLIWMAHNWSSIISALEAKIGLSEAAAPLQRIAAGLGKLGFHAVALTLPICIGFAFCLGRNSANFFRPTQPKALLLTLAERTALILLSLMVLLVGGGVSRFTAGWLAPGLILVPLILAGWTVRCGWPMELNRRLGLAVAAVIVLSSAIKIGAYGAWHGRNLGRDELFAETALTLRGAGLSNRPLITDNLLTAGNLRYYCPEVTVRSLDMPVFAGYHHDSRPGALLVWNASTRPSLAVHARVAAAEKAHPGTATLARIALDRDDLHPRFRRMAITKLPSDAEFAALKQVR